MKKIVIFMMILLFPVFTLATEYEVSDINIKIDVKSNYIVFTRDNLNNNPDLVKLNIPKEYMDELMKNNKIYYDIIKNDVSYEILVIVPDNKLKWNNLINANDELLNDIKDEFAKQTGAKVSSIYKTKYNFIVVDYYDENSKYYIVNYYTVVNARGYNFQLQKKTEITEEERLDLKEIVDSVEIDVLDEFKNETEEIQKGIDNYGKKNIDYKKYIYGAIIGASAGLISYIVGAFINKKKSSV